MEQFTFKFHYTPGVFFTRDKINAQILNSTLNSSCLVNDSDSSPQTSSQSDALIDENPPEKKIKLTRNRFEAQEEHEDIVASSSKSSSPPVSSKLGNVDLSEFGDDSILRDDSILAEAIRKTEEFNQPDETKKKINCLKCGIPVSDQRSSRFYHANTKHIRLPLYECKGCDRKWCTISRADVVKHVNNCHKGDESLIIDHRPRVRQQLRVLVELCFPKKEKSLNDYHNSSMNSEDDCMEDGEIASPQAQGKIVKEEMLEKGEEEEPRRMRKRKSDGRN